MILCIGFDKERNLTHAGAAPRCPEVDENVFVAFGLDNAAKGYLLAVGILLRDVYIWLSGLCPEFGFGLLAYAVELGLHLFRKFGYGVDNLLRREAAVHVSQQPCPEGVGGIVVDRPLHLDKKLFLKGLHFRLPPLSDKVARLDHHFVQAVVECRELVVHGRTRHLEHVVPLRYGGLTRLDEYGYGCGLDAVHLVKVGRDHGYVCQMRLLGRTLEFESRVDHGNRIYRGVSQFVLGLECDVAHVGEWLAAALNGESV